jgi:hypothetical protein
MWEPVIIWLEPYLAQYVAAYRVRWDVPYHKDGGNKMQPAYYNATIEGLLEAELTH